MKECIDSLSVASSESQVLQWSAFAVPIPVVDIAYGYRVFV